MKLFHGKKGLNPPDLTDAGIAVIVGAVFFFAVFLFLSASEAGTKTAVQEQYSALTTAHELSTYLLMPVHPEFSDENKALATELHTQGLRIIDLVKMTSPRPENERAYALHRILETYLTRGKLELVYPDGKSLEIGSIPRGITTVEEVRIPTQRPGAVIVARLSTTREPPFYR